MQECEHCERSHRTTEAAEACAAKAARAAARLAKQVAEAARRRANAEKEPEATYIRRRVHEGSSWVNIVAGLKGDYPRREDGREWHLVDAIDVDSKRLHWPHQGVEYSWPEGTIRVADLRRLVGEPEGSTE